MKRIVRSGSALPLVLDSGGRLKLKQTQARNH